MFPTIRETISDFLTLDEEIVPGGDEEGEKVKNMCIHILREIDLITCVTDVHLLLVSSETCETAEPSSSIPHLQSKQSILSRYGVISLNALKEIITQWCDLVPKQTLEYHMLHSLWHYVGRLTVDSVSAKAHETKRLYVKLGHCYIACRKMLSTIKSVPSARDKDFVWHCRFSTK